MEVHHPEHAIRSWRDFLSHMGTVVLGILIAIALEQGVQAWNRAGERDELRTALNRDGRQAISDALRTEQRCRDVIGWDMARIAQVNAALRTKTAVPPPAPLKAHDFDVPVDPAFKAAKTSGALALLPQQEILAYSEADNAVELIARTFADGVGKQGRRQEFEFSFGGPTHDYAAAAPEDLIRYRSLLVEELFAARHLARNNQQLRGLEAALLSGERNLPALYKSERSDLR